MILLASIFLLPFVLVAALAIVVAALMHAVWTIASMAAVEHLPRAEARDRWRCALRGRW